MKYTNLIRCNDETRFKLNAKTVDRALLIGSRQTFIIHFTDKSKLILKGDSFDGLGQIELYLEEEEDQ